VTVIDWCLWIPLGIIAWTVAAFVLLLFLGLLMKAAVDDGKGKKP
jgi:hypothetical protein